MIRVIVEKVIWQMQSLMNNLKAIVKIPGRIISEKNSPRMK